MDTCSHCGGTGAEPGSKVEVCPACHGSGQVRQVVNTPFGQMQQVVTCAQCGGKGKTVDRVCTVCRGAGRVRKTQSVEVKIPAGVDNGTRLRVSSKGEAGINGGPAGDLFILTEVMPDARFTRKGDDLNTTIEISYPQAALGCEVKVDTFDGVEKLDIPAGTQAGSKLRIKGARHAEAQRQRKRRHEYTRPRKSSENPHGERARASDAARERETGQQVKS